jgi:hypothetical protein
VYVITKLLFCYTSNGGTGSGVMMGFYHPVVVVLVIVEYCSGNFRLPVHLLPSKYYFVKYNNIFSIQIVLLYTWAYAFCRDSFLVLSKMFFA